jgi:hypothetical protein
MLAIDNPELAQQKLSFKPRARLIRAIGDRLISGPEAALIELIKNAHDADANWVRVSFLPQPQSENGRIIVSDDGHGMSLLDIQQKWMEPATTDKVSRSRSPNGRPLLGSKGIGRFAAARLGHRLLLQSTALRQDSSCETTIVNDINWDCFETAVYLSEVEFPFAVKHGAHAKQTTGTELIITELRDQWTEASVLNQKFV